MFSERDLVNYVRFQYLQVNPSQIFPNKFWCSFFVDKFRILDLSYETFQYQRRSTIAQTKLMSRLSLDLKSEKTGPNPKKSQNQTEE